MDTFQLVIHHWKLFLAIWLISNAISAMPSPNGSRILASGLYKWLFTFLHGSAGNIPRILATVFPSLVSRIFGIPIVTAVEEKK